MILLLPVLTGGTIVYLYCTRRMTKTAFLCLLIGTAVSAASIAADLRNGPRQEITELPGDAGGPLREPVRLSVEAGGGEPEEVSIRIPEKKPSHEEAQAYLAEQAAGLDEQILGENRSLQKVEWDMDLPAALHDGEITVTWVSSRPDVLGWNGRILEGAEETGTDVTLTAVLTMGEETLEIRRLVTVYPSRETGQLEQRLQNQADLLNEDAGTDRYLLPQELDGEELTWYRENESLGEKACLLVLLAAFLAAAAVKQKEEEREKKRRQELLRSYPEVLSKAQLLLAAGLSLRKVFERFAADYRRERKRTGRKTAVGEELLRTWYDMENGMLEQDAFTQFGERCGLAEYKAFALLLAQNQTHGGHRLPQLLETEVQQACEKRKRQARIAGEKAAVKLAAPMGLMLVVVLVIVLVPAVLSFQS